MVPCFWFAVMTRGAAIVSLLPSFWAADSSRSRRWLPVNKETPMLPLTLAAGRFTWYRLATGGVVSSVPVVVGPAAAVVAIWLVAALVPEKDKIPLLPLTALALVKPSWAPRSRS